MGSVLNIDPFTVDAITVRSRHMCSQVTGHQGCDGSVVHAYLRSCHGCRLEWLDLPAPCML